MEQLAFAHDKTIEIAIDSIVNPARSFCWGGSYVVPVHYGLLSSDFVEGLRNSSTYDDASFSREFLSKWTMSMEGSLFDYERLSKLRKIKRAEWKNGGKPNTFYVLSIDVARHKARTIMEVFRITVGEELYKKDVVNIIPMEGRNFAHQAERIKELDHAFQFDTVVIDGNGLTKNSPLAW